MKQTLSTSHAANLIAEDEYSTFSRAGAYALVEYLEQLEEDCGEEIEFDCVAIRCDYSEHDSLRDFADEYFGTTSRNSWASDIGVDDDADDEEIDNAIREYIQDRGILIEFDGGIIVSSF